MTCSPHGTLGAAPTSVARRAALLDVLQRADRRLEAGEVLTDLDRAGLSGLVQSNGRHEMVQSDLRYLERQGLTDRVRMRRNQLPGSADRWALRGRFESDATAKP